MNTNIIRISACVIMVSIGMLAFSGCSQKASSEETAARIKAAVAGEQATAPAPAASKHAAKSSSAAHAKATEPAAVAQATVCANCGVVVSVREIEQEGKGSGLGVIAGGLTGGIVGNQVGQGTGRDLATIAGVVGGAIAGNKIEQKIKKTRVYDVTVKLENGKERILRYKTVPGVAAGDRVKVENEHVVRL